MKTLKKAAVIGMCRIGILWVFFYEVFFYINFFVKLGAVAYGGYQLGKLSSRFSGYGGGYGYGDQRYGFNDWNRWREIDGFMCRDSNDCNWIDRDLYCQDYELDFQPSVRETCVCHCISDLQAFGILFQALWFGGDVARIVGECACPHGMVFDNREMQCERSFMGGIGMIVSSLFAVLILMCCCGCACFMVVRRFF